MLYVTMAAATFSVVVLFFMFLKLRKALIMIHVLQAAVNGAHASVVPSFHYKSQASTPQPAIPFADLNLSWDHGIFTISFFTLITVYNYCSCVRVT